AGMGFSLRDVSLTSLLSRADMALRRAQAEDHNGYHFYVEDDRQDTVSLVIRQADSWRATLERALEEDQFSFQYQPVMSASTGRPMQHEALVRLAVDGKLLRAGIFLPMAERFHMQAVLDRWIVSHLTSIAPARLSTPVTINISGRSVEDEGFRRWLLDHLAATAERARFVIELSEHALRPARDAVINLFESLGDLGVATSIDHFGVGGVNFSYLEMLNLSQVRVHKSLIRDLDRKGDQQFFLKSVVQVSRAANTRLIAEGIESAGEWRAVRRLGLDGGQGHFLAPPV
ncbi:MAG: EAL domain-containing protein, partial [Pseudomonadales bacterium]